MYASGAKRSGQDDEENEDEGIQVRVSVLRVAIARQVADRTNILA